MKSVLFVCLGNICRSPAGEGIFRSWMAAQPTSSSITIDSAGTIATHAGERPDQRMRQACDERGYTLSGRARQFEASDLTTFDLIIAMDQNNLADIESIAQSHRTTATITLLSHFLNQPKRLDVPDPYYGGLNGFYEVIEMIEAACPAIAERLRTKAS